MGDQNLILKQPLSAVVRDTLRAAIAPFELILTPHDLPYYFVRVVTGRPLRDQVFGPDSYAPYTERTWLRIPVIVRKDMKSLLSELKFLEGLGLAMEIPNSREADGSVQYAISPLTRILYGAGPGAEEGVFIRVETDRPGKAERFLTLLVDYVLPGMYWRNYYVTSGLAPHIHLTEHLGREMLEIGELWDDLAARIPRP